MGEVEEVQEQMKANMEAMNLEVVKLSTRYMLSYHLLDQVASA